MTGTSLPSPRANIVGRRAHDGGVAVAAVDKEVDGLRRALMRSILYSRPPPLTVSVSLGGSRPSIVTWRPTATTTDQPLMVMRM